MMSRLFKLHFLRYVSYLIAVVLLLGFTIGRTPSARAIPECSNELLKDYQIAIINCDGQSEKKPQCTTALATTGSLTSGGKVYMLGDSITYGANAKYRKAFQEKGITAFINASGGRAWTWGGMAKATTAEGTNKSGKQAVVDDTAAIHDADGIIIALGTNGGLDANPIEEIIDTIRPLAKSTSVPIWWVNIAVSTDNTKTANTISSGVFNPTLDTLASKKVYTIVDWFHTVDPSATLISNSIADPHKYMGDAVHPNASGQDQLVAKVLAAVTGTAPGPTGCGGGTLGENQKFIFDYFVSKGYTPEQAAGIVGNIMHESGVNPVRMQCIYSKDDGVSKGINESLLQPDGGVLIDNFDSVLATLITPEGKNCSLKEVSSVGWGIVQWTPFTKVVQTSQAAGIENSMIETLLFQAEFLYGQLEGTGIGGAASNEKNAGDKVKSATTVEEAAVAFAGYYERFRDSSIELPNGTRQLNLDNPEYQKRINSAVEVLAQFGSS